MPAKPKSKKTSKGSSPKAKTKAKTKTKSTKKSAGSKTKSVAPSTKKNTSRRGPGVSKKAKSSRSLASKAKVKRSPKTPSDGDNSILAVGAPAPDFALPDETGKVTSLSDFQGKQVVLYFYPKDDTPGCTKEACDFRDGIQEIRNKGAVVLGASADSVESHQKFSGKFQLNFPLLSDGSKTMLKDYGVWKEKSMYGRKFMGIERTTVLINADGIIERVWPKVKVDGHFLEVLGALR